MCILYHRGRIQFTLIIYLCAYFSFPLFPSLLSFCSDPHIIIYLRNYTNLHVFIIGCRSRPSHGSGAQQPADPGDAVRPYLHEADDEPPKHAGVTLGLVSGNVYLHI